MSKTKVGGWILGIGVFLNAVGQGMVQSPDPKWQSVGHILVWVGTAIAGIGTPVAVVGVRDALGKLGK